MRSSLMGGVVRRHQRRFCLALSLFIAAGPPVSSAAAATKVVPVQAKPVKPLTLTPVQDLDLGTILLGSGTWSGATVGI